MIEILSIDYEDTVAIKMSGELTAKDYEPVVTLMEDMMKKKGKINLYCEIEGLEEVEQSAIWKDLKFDLRHFNDFQKVALVGDKQWLEWGAKFARPFTSAAVKFFDNSEKSEALNWLAVKENA